MLKRCSDKKDVTEWNEWRNKHRTEDIELEGAEFNEMYLKDVDLKGGGYEHQETN